MASEGFASWPKGLTEVDEFLVSRMDFGLTEAVSESGWVLVKNPLNNLGEIMDEIGVVEGI